MKRNGFTLVEMLVALGIFALIAAAGVGVLRSSVDVQSSVDTRLTAVGGIVRLNALLSSDLGQAVDRPSRAPSGERPAFVGDGSRMEVVAAGRSNLDGAARSWERVVELAPASPEGQAASRALEGLRSAHPAAGGGTGG